MTIDNLWKRAAYTPPGENNLFESASILKKHIVKMCPDS